MLCLRQPVWISDLGWTSDRTVAVASRHGQVRLYDVRSQRRPVAELVWPQAQAQDLVLIVCYTTKLALHRYTTTEAQLAFWDVYAVPGTPALHH